MTKRSKIFICIQVLSLCLIVISFCCVPTGKVFGDGPEITYPEIAGQKVQQDILLPEYTRYLFYLGTSIGYLAVFISLVIAGVMYFLSPVNAGLKASAKDRFVGAISGLLIITLTYLIITTINPQLSLLFFIKPPTTYCTPEGKCMQADKTHPGDVYDCKSDDACPQPIKKQPGVYFYKNSCDNSATPNTSGIADLGDELRNNVHSVDIVRDYTSDLAYISILYNGTNFRGSCMYLDPNGGCQPTNPFAASASIYQYDFSSNGNGVTFYRKSFFDESGGYLTIPVSGIYFRELADLTFDGVPEEDKKCMKYDDNGKCTFRETPTLEGENISSIKVEGNYVVLLFYFGPKDASGGPWTSCQEFPTTDDTNKTGPQQIKWQEIRNNQGVLPNYVAIFPVKKQ